MLDVVWGIVGALLIINVVTAVKSKYQPAIYVAIILVFFTLLRNFLISGRLF